MRLYIEYAKKSFQNNMMYRVNTFVGALNIIVSIFVQVAIWTAIGKINGALGETSISAIFTYFIISMGLNFIYQNLTDNVAWQVVSGEIAVELLKPVHYVCMLFSKAVGMVVYKFLLQLMPAVLLSVFVFGLMPPSSTGNFVFFIISIFLGFTVIFLVDFIVAISAFWFHHVFFLTQVKNALITILSGVLVPVWFLPDILKTAIRLTPFEAIYFIPISIYLGDIQGMALVLNLLKQCAWIVFLSLCSVGIWIRGLRKLVIQGG